MPQRRLQGAHPVQLIPRPTHLGLPQASDTVSPPNSGHQVWGAHCTSTVFSAWGFSDFPPISHECPLLHSLACLAPLDLPRQHPASSCQQRCPPGRPFPQDPGSHSTQVSLSLPLSAAPWPPTAPGQVPAPSAWPCGHPHAPHTQPTRQPPRDGGRPRVLQGLHSPPVLPTGMHISDTLPLPARSFPAPV